MALEGGLVEGGAVDLDSPYFLVVDCFVADYWTRFAHFVLGYFERFEWRRSPKRTEASRRVVGWRG